MNMTGKDQCFGGSTSVSAIMRWLMDRTEMVSVLDYQILVPTMASFIAKIQQSYRLKL
jgi:hypothetical protein